MALATLALAHGTAIRLFETKGVVEAMLNAAQRGETSAIKEEGLKGLANLALAEENQISLFKINKVVKALLRAAQHGETSRMREESLLGLANLAASSENGFRLFEIDGMVDAMLEAAEHGETSEMKENGLLGLTNLAVAGENRIRLFKTKGVVEAMVKAAQQGEFGIKNLGIRGLVNFATVTENQVRLFETNGVVEAMLRAVQEGVASEIKTNAFRCLCNISTNVQVADGLVVDHDLISRLNETSSSDFDFVRSCIYLNLAVAPRAREALKQDHTAIDRIERLERSHDEHAREASTLALAILRGSDGGNVDALQSEVKFKTILDVLDGAITPVINLRNYWPLYAPLLALRYLTTVESNRVRLGTEWLSSLPSAIQKGLDLKDASIVESAMRCLSQYALDASTLPVLKANVDKYASIAELVIQYTSDADEEWIGAKNSAQSLLVALKG